MTLLAGVYRRRGAPLSDAFCDDVTSALSRHRGERTSCFRDEHCFIAKVDIGAFGEDATVVDAAGATFVTGEPILTVGAGPRRSRTFDTHELHRGRAGGDWTALTAARGVFSAVQYRRDPRSLSLVADKLAIRPLYYWIGEEQVVFASAIRILETLRQVPKRLDPRGVAELFAFGFPLGARTPYESIQLLRPAEVIEIDGATVSRRRYWRWEDIEASDRPMSELARDSHLRFSEAVAIRAGTDHTVAAFLSGGLDSRAIVTALREQERTVQTYNFGITGTLDAVLATTFADAAGAVHTQAPRKAGRPAWSAMMAQALHDAARRADGPDRPQIAWSGDGGSVGVGHVYLDQRLVDTARSTSNTATASAIDAKLGGAMPEWSLQPSFFASVDGAAQNGVLEELETIECSDAGRRLYLFLMYNDQRRHLFEHFEDIDIHRLEFELPFFDSDFLTSVSRVPTDLCLGHKFYMEWLRQFPAVALSTPWQAYPGHEPCPLPLPKARYQWGKAQWRVRARIARRELVEQATSVLHAPDFPSAMIRRNRLRFATLVLRLGLRDVRHLVSPATLVHRYWSRCGTTV